MSWCFWCNLMDASLLGEKTMDLVRKFKSSERSEIPPRSDPDNFTYIITDQEKSENLPLLPTDECWVLNHFWSTSDLTQKSDTFGPCFWRRRKGV